MKLQESNNVKVLSIPSNKRGPGSVNYVDKRSREKIISEFYDPTPPINDIPEEDIVGSIYMIYNVTNEMKYIGQTKNFRRRIVDYVRYSNPSIQFSKSTRITKMYRTIRDEGISNFRMRRYYDCTTYEELAEKEREFILSLNTIDPNGYNTNANLDYQYFDSKLNKENRSKAQKRIHSEKPASADHRRKLSVPVFVIDTLTKTIIFADSAALAGKVLMDIKRGKQAVHAVRYHYKLNQRYFILPANEIELKMEYDNAENMYNCNEYRAYNTLIRCGLETVIDNGFEFMILRYEDNQIGYSFYSISSFLSAMNPIINRDIASLDTIEKSEKNTQYINDEILIVDTKEMRTSIK